MDSSQQPLAPEPQIIDFQRLEEVCSEDAEAMQELAEFFFTQAEDEMAGMERALAAESAEDIRRLAHRLLGASSGCGMVAMVPPLADMEQAGKNADFASANDLFARLKILLEQSRAEIARWRSALG